MRMTKLFFASFAFVVLAMLALPISLFAGSVELQSGSPVADDTTACAIGAYCTGSAFPASAASTQTTPSQAPALGIPSR